MKYTSNIRILENNIFNLIEEATDYDVWAEIYCSLIKDGEANAFYNIEYFIRKITKNEISKPKN